VALTEAMKSNCIDCHMPALNSSAIAFKGSDVNNMIRTDSVQVRTHKIGVYTKIN